MAGVHGGSPAGVQKARDTAAASSPWQQRPTAGAGECTPLARGSRVRGTVVRTGVRDMAGTWGVVRQG